MQELNVGQKDSGRRADIYLTEQLKEYPRSVITKLFEDANVLINNKPVKAGQRLKFNDIVSVDLSPLKKKMAMQPLPVIYEDESVVVMSKPAGLLTHSKGVFNHDPTVAAFLLTKITDKNLSGNRAGIVHRLDRATAGVIIGARNSESLKWLQKQFSSRKVKKTYLAVVEGVPELSKAVIDTPIARNPHRPQTFRVASTGKQAVTEYEVVKSFDKNHKTYSLIKLRPITGRTHQLRVHLKYIGHPIVGDEIYGFGNGPLLLQSSELELTLPDRTRKTFSVKLSKDLKDFIE